MPRVTLEQIAKLAATDRGTVSRVLNGRAKEFHIGDDVAGRVRAIADELNYMPNAVARALSAGRFGSAALLMSTEHGRSYLPIRLLDGIHDQLAASDMHLTVARLPDEKLSGAEVLPKILRTLMADGLLINYTHRLPPHMAEAVENLVVPAVWINTDRPSDAIVPDNRAAARTATQHLIDIGHRRIAFFTFGDTVSDTWHYSVRDRSAGYAEAMRAAGLEPIEFRRDAPGEGLARLADLLSGPGRVTAVLCYWITFVPAVLRVASECGLRVPRDLSVVSFAAEDNSHASFGASMMCEPQYRMGQEAVRMLLEKVEGPRSMPSTPLDFYWVERDISAVPPA